MLDWKFSAADAPKAKSPKPARWLGSRRWIYAVLVTLFPAVVWLLFIWRFSLPVLYEDDWSLIPFIIHLRKGTLHFAEYWAPHGPHPLIVTRAFFAFFFRSGPLDPRPIMICSWLLATTSVVIANRCLVWPRVCEWGGSLSVLSGLAFSVWALSLVQYESQLWGFEISFIATLCCALLGASVLAVSGWNLWVRLALSLLIGAAATLTSGQGLMLLPALAIGCLFFAQRWMQRALVTGGFLLVIGLTLWLYHRDRPNGPSGQELFGWFIARPQLALAGIFGLLGSPLTYIRGSHRVDSAPGEGLALFVIFGMLLFLAVRRRNLRECAPFVALGVYSLLYAALVAAGRAPDGYNDWFLTSRYTTSALCLCLAVLGFYLVLFAGTQKTRQLMLQVALIGFIGLGLANSIAATSMANEDRIMRRAAMRLLDYQNLFHAELDGCGTGPFFPLFPVGTARVAATALTPARDAGLIPPERPVSFTAGISGSWNRKPGHKSTYLTHLCWAEELSGNLQSGESFTPDVVLVRRTGDPLFTTFGIVTGNRWRIVLGPEVAAFAQDPVEVFAFETSTGRLAPIQRSGVFEKPQNNVR
jgi:hypothetical protein